MEIILIGDMPSVGEIGDVVKVKPGYARNFLLPRGLALPASKKNKKELDHKRRIAAVKLAQATETSKGMAAALSGKTFTIARKVGEQDKLYGSVTSSDVQAALAAKDIKVDRRKIDLSEPIKALGTFELSIKLAGGISAPIKLEVVAE